MIPINPEAMGFGNGPNLARSITKRELFAAMAMQGLSAHMKWSGSYSELDRRDKRPETEARWIAIAAVRYADALIAELSK